MALTKQEQQIALGVGGIALVAGGIAWWMAKPKAAAASSTSTLPIDTGIWVHPNCTDWTVTNPGKLAVTLNPVIDELTLAGVRSPWDLAAAMLKRVAPQCQQWTPAATPRNSFEAYLIYRLVLEAVLELRRRNLITPLEAQNHWMQANAWALYHKVTEGNLYDYQET